MSLTTLDNFINIYCVEDGMLANAVNVNKSPIQLKKEIDEVYTNLTSTKNSKQVLDATDAIQIDGKVLSLKKGDASIESVSLDLFDTKVDKIVSVDNRVPRFNGTSGNIKLSSVAIDDNGNLVVPGSITSNTGVLTGNAASATKLQTARLIGGVSFDGTANITLPGVNSIGNQNTTGNAASATKLQTARLIGGVSFDGTANIDLPGVNIAGNQNTSGNAFSATKLQTARLIGGVSFDGTANITLPGVNAPGNQNAASATKLQTARLIGGVSFDGTADITLPGVNAAGNQNTSGNSASATKLQTPRSINLSGVSATAQNFDGTSNIVIPITSIPGSLLTGNAQLSGFGNDYNGGGLMLNGNGTANTVYPTLGFHQSGLYAGSIQLRSGGNFSFYQQGGTALGTINAGTVNAELIGNAASATKLKSARLIGGVSFDGTANIDLPGVNIAGNQNTSGNSASATKLQTARLIGGVSFDGTANIDLPGVNAPGNQNTSGNSASATKLQTPRSITLSGVLSGSANFDGSSNITIAASHTADPTITLSGGVTGSGVMYDLGNVTISTTVANDSHTHDTRYYVKAQSDSLFVNSGGDTLSGALLPNANGTIDFGSQTLRWKTLYGTATASAYADLAEKYLTDKVYEVGTVLEVGGEFEATLYNGGPLCGVISESPGLMINSESDGQYIALKGKVPVKCNSEIKKGQYCLASNGGFVIGVDYFDANYTLKVVGVALEDSKNNKVMVKI